MLEEEVCTISTTTYASLGAARAVVELFLVPYRPTTGCIAVTNHVRDEFPRGQKSGFQQKEWGLLGPEVPKTKRTRKRQGRKKG